MRARGVVQSPVLVGRDDFLALAGDRLAGAAVGAVVLAAAADQLAQSFGPARPTAPWHPLSEREFEVAKLVAAGLTNPQIAAQLVLAPKTISAHVYTARSRKPAYSSSGRRRYGASATPAASS